MLAHTFAQRLVAWQKTHGRHALPWQGADPYRIWLSEIMLQQTQVAVVMEYYTRFLEQFPSLEHLANATLHDVLERWSGLGYYSRARNLHRAANQVMTMFAGKFPSQLEDMQRLPGIGRSTAGAIAVFAFGQRQAILDGNVKRVLTRVFGIQGFLSDRNVEAQLWATAESLLPTREIEAYTQGLMDLGATVCTKGKRALCNVCPMVDGCVAAREGRVADLPATRPRKALPTRYTIMLLATYEGKVWVTRRPPAGIWGGLLSLPEFESRDAVANWVVQQGVGELLPAWAEMTHTFSHYRLVIMPQPVRLTSLDVNGVREHDGCWLPLSEAYNAGVPAAVKKLLQTLARQG